jgi:ABC-2 type transport system ATP-binding protein
VINGFDMEQNPIKAKKHIGYVPEGSPLHDELRTIDFLKYCAQVKGVKNIKSTIQNIAIKLQIQDKLYVKIATLSKGYKRRVSIAQALLSNPAILILDEPTDGLDPNQKQVIRDLINEIKAEKTIIIATHLLEEADEICNKIIIMDKSKIKLQSSMNEIRKQDKTLIQIFKSLTNNKNDEVNQ